MAIDIKQVPGWRELRALRARLASKRGRRLMTALALIAAPVLPYALALPGLSDAGRLTLALFGLSAVLWLTELVPLFVTSLFILAVSIIGLVPALRDGGIPVGDEVFLNAFFSNVTLLFMGGLLLAQAASRHRLDLWFAARLLALAGGRPHRVLLAIMAASAFLSMWMSNTATTAMMLILVVALVRQLPPEAGQFRKALFLGVPFSCNLGGLGTPIGTPPNAIAVSLLEARGETIGFLAWMASSLPLLIILIWILWRLLLRAFPPPDFSFSADATASGRADATFPATFPAGWRPRATLAVFGLSVLLWLTGGVTGLSSGEVALLAAVVLLGSGLLEPKDFRGISWDVLFLVGGGLALGLAVELSGLAAWLGAGLDLGGLHEAVLIAVFVAVAAVLTTFMSNTATANMLMPIALATPLGDGVSPTSIVVAIAMATSTSMLLPVSTPPNAIAYYSGEIDIKDMLGRGAAISAIAALLTWGAALTLWHWLGLGA
jgi:sodium-dependent dicarboxylate transporter 2/3/5